jgi:hypothetical protein
MIKVKINVHFHICKLKGEGIEVVKVGHYYQNGVQFTSLNHVGTLKVK